MKPLLGLSVLVVAFALSFAGNAAAKSDATTSNETVFTWECSVKHGRTHCREILRIHRNAVGAVTRVELKQGRKDKQVFIVGRDSLIVAQTAINRWISSRGLDVLTVAGTVRFTLKSHLVSLSRIEICDTYTACDNCDELKEEKEDLIPEKELILES